MSDFYKFNLTIAHKVHRCYECSGSIQIGEFYHRHCGTWEGEFFTSKNCDDCEHLRADINEDLAQEDKIGFGDLCGDCMENEGADYVRFLKIKMKRGAKLSKSQLNFIKEGGLDE
jgi:hypothetical protein